jgi:hypothetical protein
MKLATIAALFALSARTPLSAQMQPERPCTLGETMHVYYGVNPQKNAPFMALTKTTFEQQLPDGNAIHTVTHARQARDSSGRTMAEQMQGCERGQDGQLHKRIFVQVSDQVARTSMSWDVRYDEPDKVVRVLHFSDPKPLTPEEQAANLQRIRQQQVQQPSHGESKMERLGTRIINGVEAEGDRTTRTIPAGEEGNDQPLLVVDEVWRSRKFDLVLLAIHDDPRQGKTTFEYEDLNLAEPDASMFAPPADYKVQEIQPNRPSQ